jgi:hypothetical protein
MQRIVAIMQQRLGPNVIFNGFSCAATSGANAAPAKQVRTG